MGYKLKISEKEINNFLAKNLNLVEEGLSLIKQEFKIDEHQNIDLLCKDINQKLVIVKIKKGIASDNLVGQILRYIVGIKKKFKTNDIRIILIVEKKRDFIVPALESLEYDIQIKYLRKTIPAAYFTKETINKKEAKSKYIGLRVKNDFYDKHLKDKENMSKFIVKCLKNYNPIMNGYIKFDSFFKKIAEQFQNGRKTISINDFIDMCEKEIDYDLIDKINEVVIK